MQCNLVTFFPLKTNTIFTNRMTNWVETLCILIYMVNFLHWRNILGEVGSLRIWNELRVWMSGNSQAQQEISSSQMCLWGEQFASFMLSCLLNMYVFIYPLMPLFLLNVLPGCIAFSIKKFFQTCCDGVAEESGKEESVPGCIRASVFPPSCILREEEFSNVALLPSHYHQTLIKSASPLRAVRLTSILHTSSMQFVFSILNWASDCLSRQW